MDNRILAIHDLSGFGNASLMTVIPIMYTMGFQVCALPTAILSSTTCYDEYVQQDTSPIIQAFIKHWKDLHLTFKAIYSGFLGTPIQAEYIRQCIDIFQGKDIPILIDPVLGDNGVLYRCYNDEMVTEMRSLIAKATIITPNLTEAALLLDRPYPSIIDVDTVSEWLKDLASLTRNVVIITSVNIDEHHSALFGFDKSRNVFYKVDFPNRSLNLPGCGDTLATALLGYLLKGESIERASYKAVEFVQKSLTLTLGQGTDPRDGINLEHCLHLL